MSLKIFSSLDLYIFTLVDPILELEVIVTFLSKYEALTKSEFSTEIATSSKFASTLISLVALIPILTYGSSSDTLIISLDEILAEQLVKNPAEPNNKVNINKFLTCRIFLILLLQQRSLFFVVH